MSITHLEVHSYYSLLQSATSPQAYVDQAVAHGLTHLALTDDWALHGAVTFSKRCLAADIQPITGLTLRVQALTPQMEPGKLVLLATGPKGYQSLCRISSSVQQTEQREMHLRQGINWSLLEENASGLICLSGGRYGLINQALKQSRDDAAYQVAERLAVIFGDNVYFALEQHDPTDVQICTEVTRIANKIGQPTVVAQPIYALQPHMQTQLKLLSAIERNTTVDTPPTNATPHLLDEGIDLHWLPPAELEARWADHPQALNAISEIANRCLPALPDGRAIWPVLKHPTGQSPAMMLKTLAKQGLLDRYDGTDVTSSDRQTIESRLEKELTLIIERDYAPLFLIVADIVRYARENGVPVSTRGSVANSLVAYCLAITTVDPITHNLIFERFLNPSRSDPPDIDLDFCSRRRDQVLAYVRQTYGENQVALVGSISTMQPKSAVRAVGKAYGLEEAQIKRLGRLMPHGRHPDPRRRKRADLETVLAEISDSTEKIVLTEAFALIGQPHHLSLHPGGLVITPGPLSDVVPVQMSPKGFLATQYDHHDVEALGLQKIDLLGISALTVLADAADLIRTHCDSAFDLDTIPNADSATGEMLARGDGVGVFQCESTGARSTLIKLNARTVTDLAVANAFFKPGPALGGMADAFVRRYRRQAQVSYLHPALEPILAESKGVLLFQEQILRVAVEIAGLSWAEADFIRRGISKFRDDQVQQMRQRFLEGCLRRPPDGSGLTQTQAETLWEQISAFAGYGFNKGHATAYAAVSYQMAYLKRHFPAPFLAARLQTHGGFHHQAIYIAEARRLGIIVKAPHVNHSVRKFTLEEAADHDDCGTLSILWMGLGQVRDLRRKSVQAIIDARHVGPFQGLRDLLNRVDLQPKEIDHLIKAGALDGLGDSRAALLAEVKRLARSGDVRQLGFDFGDDVSVTETVIERLAWEEALLGLPISLSPLEAISTKAATPITLLETLFEQPDVKTTIHAYRMPGWTGGKGFFISDGQTYLVAQSSQSLKPPPVWQPAAITGQLKLPTDGVPWLQILDVAPVAFS